MWGQGFQCPFPSAPTAWESGPSGCPLRSFGVLILTRAGASRRPGAHGDQWLCAESVNEANGMRLTVPPASGSCREGPLCHGISSCLCGPTRSPGDLVSAWLPAVRGAEAADGAQPQSTGCN